MKLTELELKQIIKEELEAVINEAEFDPSRRGFLTKLGKGAAALGATALLGKAGTAQAATATDEGQIKKIVRMWKEVGTGMLDLADEVANLPEGYMTAGYIRLLARQGTTSVLETDHEGVSGHGWREVGARINELIQGSKTKK